MFISTKIPVFEISNEKPVAEHTPQNLEVVASNPRDFNDEKNSSKLACESYYELRPRKGQGAQLRPPVKSDMA